MTLSRIMIIEDDPEINSLLELHLTRAGHEVLARSQGIHIEDEPLDTIDLFLLDVMLPMINGFELIGVIRAKTWAPIILITARTGESDRIRGLDLGADDYVCKPFSIAELLSRVHAQLRRVQKLTARATRQNEVTCGDLSINVAQHSCTRSHLGVKDDIQLNPIEFKMLYYFMNNSGSVLSKTQIYEAIWDEPYYGDDNTIMVHIRRLREKIELQPNAPRYLLTVRGVGYKLVKFSQKE